MIRRPPRSTRTDTLFPYTTLFRSDVEQHLGAVDVVVEPQPGSVGEVVALAGVVGHRPGGVDEGALHERRTRPARLVGAGGGIDREQLVVAGDHLLARAVELEPALRSEERRVGEEWVKTCVSRGVPQ